MNKESEYEYNVAFTFVASNEDIVKGIISNFKNSVNHFAYFERQKELAGKNGMIEFSKVFKESSRVVVVVLNEQWGETDWTRLEKGAIEERVLSEGHEFLIFVKTDSSPLPKWYFRPNLYLNLNTQTIDSIADIIEYKIKSIGGDLSRLTSEDVLKSKVEENRHNQELKKYLGTPEAVEDELKEFEIVKNRLQERLEYFKSNYQLRVGKFNYNWYYHEIIVLVDSYKVIVRLSNEAISTTINDTLAILIMKMMRDKSSQVFEEQYRFSKTFGGVPCWVKGQNNVTSEDLIENLLMYLIKKI